MAKVNNEESVYSISVNSTKSLTLDNAKHIILCIYTIQMYIFNCCPTVFLTTLYHSAVYVNNTCRVKHHIAVWLMVKFKYFHNDYEYWLTIII